MSMSVAIPEWKLPNYDVNSLQWHEYFDQFRSTTDSATLSDGQNKINISEVVYHG